MQNNKKKLGARSRDRVTGSIWLGIGIGLEREGLIGLGI